MNKTLHIIRTSPFQHSDLQQCLQVALEQDTILLIDDGAYAVNHTLINENNGTMLVIGDHRVARGLSAVKHVNEIDFNEFVNLTLSHQNTITWQS